jgi:hypothetical protein
MIGLIVFPMMGNAPVPTSIQKVRPPAKAKAKENAVRVPEGRPAFDLKEWKHWAERDGATWLASRNRDAASLMAAWDLTGDESLLKEAAERFPDNPLVCQAMLNQLVKTGAGPEEQEGWAEQFIAAVPDNPLGYYQRARLLAEKNDLPATMAAVEEALSKSGRPDHFEREHMMAIKEGVLAGGASVREACLASLNAPIERANNTGLSFVAGRAMRFFMDRLEGMKSEGKEEGTQALGELGLRMMEQVRLSPAPSYTNELIVKGGKIVFLQAMDPETGIGDTGRTAAQEIERLRIQQRNDRAQLDQFSKIEKEAANAPVGVVSRYTDIMMLEGAMAAIRYLTSEHEKGGW